MAIPTAYTEQELSEYMLSVTSAVSETVGETGLQSWHFAEAVNDVLVAYDVTDIADAIDIAKLRSLAKVEAWRTVIGYLMTAYDFSADGASYKRSQMLAAAEKAMASAQADAEVNGYSTAYAIQMGTIIYSDAYAITESEDDYAS
jgi:hypothetical protein